MSVLNLSVDQTFEQLKHLIEAHSTTFKVLENHRQATEKLTLGICNPGLPKELVQSLETALMELNATSAKLDPIHVQLEDWKIQFLSMCYANAFQACSLEETLEIIQLFNTAFYKV